MDNILVMDECRSRGWMVSLSLVVDVDGDGMQMRVKLLSMVDWLAHSVIDWFTRTVAGGLACGLEFKWQGSSL